MRTRVLPLLAAVAAAVAVVGCTPDPEVIVETETVIEEVEVVVEVMPESCTYVSHQGTSVITIVDELLSTPGEVDPVMVMVLSGILDDYDWDLHRECVAILDDED
ncbi:hypothetical protein [Phytoactinopolyspora limicola]|uniref:hypothetical protein n=1 Tax=Phytoactinopolyspora limicola TaxID=2715536 RepID=UPI00140BF2AF|nr:hypothetical protein [Phytoactinopolyspora limicola]